MRRNSLFWGLVLIIFGILFLLNSTGLISINVWGLIWPVLLIAFGAWILFGAALRQRPGRDEQVSIPFDSASRARIRVSHGAGRLSLSGTPNSRDLVNGTFSCGLDYHTRQDGDLLDVEMRVPEGIFPLAWGPGGVLDWTFSLTGVIPLSLDFNTGASESQIDLSSLRVSDFSLKTGASSTQITLPSEAGMTRVRIGSGAARVSIKVPYGVAARVRINGQLAGIEVDQTRFPRQGDLYVSGDYDAAQNKVDIDVDTGVGSIDIR